MQVVDLDDVLGLEKVLAELLKVDVVRSRLEQDVPGLTQQRPRRPGCT